MLACQLISAAVGSERVMCHRTSRAVCSCWFRRSFVPSPQTGTAVTDVSRTFYSFLFLWTLSLLPLLMDVHTHHPLPLAVNAEGSFCGSARGAALCFQHPHNPSLESFIWRWKWQDTIALRVFIGAWTPPCLRPTSASAFFLFFFFALMSSFDLQAVYQDWIKKPFTSTAFFFLQVCYPHSLWS